MSTLAPGPAPGRFPCAHSGEPDLPRYLRVRAEGLPLRRVLWDGLAHLRKYRRPKTSAPPEEVRYFDDQRRLLRLLADGPEGGPRLALLGDLMWLRSAWDSFLSPGVLDYLNGHAAVLGSLHTVISPRYPVPHRLPACLTYNSDPALVRAFRQPPPPGSAEVDGGSTFSALSVANDHCLDHGDQGLLDTLDFLDAQGVPAAGVRRRASGHSFVTFRAGGFTFGFHAACWGFNDPNRGSELPIEVLPGLGVPSICHPVDLAGVRKALADMDAEQVDFKVVGLHWGYRFEFYPCPVLMQVGREIARAGADVVMGSHPHVVQPVEVCLVNGYERRYWGRGPGLAALEEPTGCVLRDEAHPWPRKALIAYSLGNFATAMWTLPCQVGMVLSLTLARDPDTGRVDWHRPEVQLVHNVGRDPSTGGRRLVLVESYLRQRQRAGDAAAALRDTVAFLERHVLGPR